MSEDISIDLATPGSERVAEGELPFETIATGVVFGEGPVWDKRDVMEWQAKRAKKAQEVTQIIDKDAVIGDRVILKETGEEFEIK